MLCACNIQLLQFLSFQMPKHKFKSPNGAAKKKKCESALTLNSELINNIDKYKVSLWLRSLKPLGALKVGESRIAPPFPIKVY